MSGLYPDPFRCPACDWSGRDAVYDAQSGTVCPACGGVLRVVDENWRAPP